jgi:uncharacterized membrane protein YebE (DUF533 family)
VTFAALLVALGCLAYGAWESVRRRRAEAHAKGLEQSQAHLIEQIALMRAELDERLP